jgi:hypothetical protein
MIIIIHNSTDVSFGSVYLCRSYSTLLHQTRGEMYLSILVLVHCPLIAVLQSSGCDYGVKFKMLTTSRDASG